MRLLVSRLSCSDCNIYYGFACEQLRSAARGAQEIARNMHILVTGAAGFIGADLCHKLLGNGHQIVGMDNFNDYYDVSLKRARVERLVKHANSSQLSIVEMDLCDRAAVAELFMQQKFDVVVHLAAQAGVRYSIDNPQSYIDSNLLGFGNILEGCRQATVAHLVYASSSSVYGANKNFPFRESDHVDNPVSLYAATKKANELMAHSYAHLYGMRCTGLRFFTVYGPWGRPDMAPMRFASRMLAGTPIPVYNNGEMIRDFTYIDDINQGVVSVAESSTGSAYKIYNIGRGEPVQLLHFIEVLADRLGVKAQLEMLPMQDGDVPRTMEDTAELQKDFGYKPKVSVEQGIGHFVDWYKQYFQH